MKGTTLTLACASSNLASPAQPSPAKNPLYEHNLLYRWICCEYKVLIFSKKYQFWIKMNKKEKSLTKKVYLFSFLV